MKLSLPKIFLLTAIVLSIGTSYLHSQSTDQNFPTPITSNEINGMIKARDIGDGRLTRYFYAFDGGQGDIFINVVTKNFAGDIDVFTAEAFKPLTKMVIYPDSTGTETGRLVYLRKEERLILRIEGRPSNDDPAVFRIKFGGSFIALANEKRADPPTIKGGDVENDSGIRVNSVGTIIDVVPKPKPAKTMGETRAAAKEQVAKVSQKPSVAKAPEPKPEPKKSVAVVIDAPEVKTISVGKDTATEKSGETSEKATQPKARTTTAKPARANISAKSTKPIKPADPPVEKKPDPLASIRLVVQLKTGETIEWPMSEVLKFSVDKGVLTVIQKDGKISRYSIFDVVKVTIW